MALKAWLASLKTDVSSVTAAQAPVYEGLPCNGAEKTDITGVTFRGGVMAGVTAVTAAQNHPLQREPAWIGACTAVTAVTCKKIDTEASTENQRLIQRLIPHRLTSVQTVPTTDADRWCWPHSGAMTSSEIDTFTARVHQFMRQGLAESEAEVLADKLVRRDRGDGVAGKQQPTVAAKPEPRTNRCIPWLTEREAIAATAYHQHHFSCPMCIAAGRGEQYGTRCTVGLALWDDYSGATPTTQPTKGTP